MSPPKDFDEHIDKDNTVNTSFKWNFGGQSVQVAGTFTNWKSPIVLSKHGNEFNAIMRLPRGVHQ